MGNDNFTDEERRNQQEAVNKLMQMIAADRVKYGTGAKDIYLQLAETYKSIYDAYITVGFTKEEAFELLKLEVSGFKNFVNNRKF